MEPEDPQIARFLATGSAGETAHDAWLLYEATGIWLEGAQRWISRTARVAESALLVGPVVVGERATILPNAFVEGPCIIGPDVIIGNSAMVRAGSVVSAGSVVGSYCYSTAALIGPDSRVAHFCGVSRSIIESRVHMSAFVVTATVRPDYRPIEIPGSGKHVKRGCIIRTGCYVGPHTVLHPGIHVGAESYIGPHVVVEDDVDPGTRLLVRQELSVTSNSLRVKPRSRGLHLSTDAPQTDFHDDRSE